MFIFLTTVILSCVCWAQAFLSVDDLSASTKYDVQISLDATTQFVQVSLYTVNMFSKYGQTFTCTIPSDTGHESNTTVQPPTVNNLYIKQVLSRLDKIGCLEHTKVWWTYEFCYQNHVVQYHKDDEQRFSETLLGRFDSETDWDNVPEDLEKPLVHKQNYTRGSLCELKFKPRRVEVQFVCAQVRSFRILDVEEYETCVYRIVVGVSLLCSHPSFVTHKDPTVAPILCRPVVSDKTSTLDQPGNVPTISANPRVNTFAAIGEKIHRRMNLRHVKNLLRQFLITLVTPIPFELHTSTRHAFETYVKLARNKNTWPFSHSVERSELVQWYDILKPAAGYFFDNNWDEVLLVPKPGQDDHIRVMRTLWSLLTSLVRAKFDRLSEPGARPLRFHHARLYRLVDLFKTLSNLLSRPKTPVITTASFVKMLQRFHSDGEPSEKNVIITIRFRSSEFNILLSMGSKEFDPRWNYSPTELKALRHQMLLLDLILNHVDEPLLHSDVADSELFKTIEKAIVDTKFKVLVLRQQPREGSTLSHKAQASMMLSMLKNVLNQVDPEDLQGLEIYDSTDIEGNVSTFFIVSSQEKAKETKRMEKLERAYKFQKH